MKHYLRIAGVLMILTAEPAGAEERYRSVLFQNDLFLGHDGGGYTNGIFFSQIDVTSPGEGQIEPSLLLRQIAPLLGLPGATLTASSLGQLMVTPRDITRVHPDPNDAPYAGALVFRSAQVYVHDDTAEILALSVGVIGPASGAAQTQRLAHRLVGTNRPEGWDSQVPNRPLLGLERYRSWRWADRAADHKLGSDVILMGGGSIGNLESSAGMSLTVRYGQGLERSFPAVGRLSVNSADPVLIGTGWFGFASLSADRRFNYVGIGSDSPIDNDARLQKSRFLGTIGLVYGWGRSSVSFALQSANPVVRDSRRAQSYGSLTFTYRIG